MNMRRILSGALGNERKASHTKQQRKKWKKKKKKMYRQNESVLRLLLYLSCKNHCDIRL